ncbi:MAG: spore coat protein [Xylanivirga thermophila]|jgi:spore coat protein CotF|uniref:spore coat protein n=1 Tax=Xylanivirga thermophila TaxID=2496273 RepID=UPI00101E1DDF|nr:spore coat protein [Xylanivirga thermophila]
MSQNQLSEKDMLQDSITIEKQISSSYDTTIMESVNDQIIKTLQDIQREEQNHAKLFMEAMNKRGWYSVEPSHPSQYAQDAVNKQISAQVQPRIQELDNQLNGE